MGGIDFSDLRWEVLRPFLAESSDRQLVDCLSGRRSGQGFLMNLNPAVGDLE